MDIASQTQSDPACCAAADVEAKIYHRLVVDYAGEKYNRVIDRVWIWKGITQICSDTCVVRVSCQIDRIFRAPLVDRVSRQHERCFSPAGHFRIESTGKDTPFFITVSISEACAMSSSGFELRITRSAKKPLSRLPICAPVSPPKSFAAFVVAHCTICMGVSPASFIN